MTAALQALESTGGVAHAGRVGDREAVGELELQASAAALRALADQEARLRDVRARTATLLAAAAVCASFFGPSAVAGEGSIAMVLASVSAFVVTLLAALYVLLPDDDLIFGLDGVVMYRGLWDVRHDPDEVHRRLVYWMADFRVRNKPIIDRKARACRVALRALGDLPTEVVNGVG